MNRAAAREVPGNFVNAKGFMRAMSRFSSVGDCNKVTSVKCELDSRTHRGFLNLVTYIHVVLLMHQHAEDPYKVRYLD